MGSKIEFSKAAFPFRVRIAIGLLGLQRFLPFRESMRKFKEEMYFFYRRHLDGGMHRLCKRHPELFQQGHLIDIGSHIGAITEALAGVCSGRFGVLSVEPEERNFQTLQRRMKRFPHVRSWNLALSDKNRESILVKSSWHFGAHFLAGEDHSVLHENSQSVRCLTLDGVVNSLGWKTSDLCFIKVDTEGEEVRVLRGMPKVLASDRISVLVEICPEALRRQGSKALELVQLLEDAGFCYFYRLNRFGELQQVDPRTELPERGWEDWLCRKQPLEWERRSWA